MKYKILKGTETFKQLWVLRKKMSEVDKASHKILKRFGADQYRSAFDVIAGGLSCLMLKECPKGWKSVNGGYFPKRNVKANAELLAEIDALPVIKKNDLNSLVGFEPQFIGNKYSYCVGMIWRKKYCLMEMNEGAKFKPNADMKEITVSEFNKLAA